MKHNPICPYCGEVSSITIGKYLFPKSPETHTKHYFVCEPCNAYCKVYPKSLKPHGVLAKRNDKPLIRMARKQVQEVIETGHHTQTTIIQWLTDYLKTDSIKLSQLDVKQAPTVLEFVKDYWQRILIEKLQII